MSFDLKINWIDDEESLTLHLTDEKLEKSGQHGSAIILESQSDEKFLLKIFSKVIDSHSKEIPFEDVDLGASPDTMKDRLQLWRAINEYTASNLAMDLELNVPEAILITSSKISEYPLDFADQLPLPEDDIILDEELGAPETAEEFYLLSMRDTYTIQTSEKFEALQASQSDRNDPTTDVAKITKLIPNSKSIEQFLDEEPSFEKAVEKISSIDNA